MRRSRGARRGCLPWSFSWLRPVEKRDPFPSLYPPLFPSRRLDIHDRLPSQQPAECTLLHLPPELRQCIYAEALGGRLIALKLVASRTHGHCVVRSEYYNLPEDPASGHLWFTRTAVTDSIHTALLLSCRQVYFEALPIMYRCNTFHFLVRELEIIVLSGLGGYCLPDIRSVYLFHNYRTMDVPPWDTTFQLLRRMRLSDLTFEFGFQLLEWTELSPRRDVLNSAWARGVLGIRGLRTFRLSFTSGDPPEYPVYRNDITERLHRLMIEPGAEERYRDFLQDQERI
ncbi:hypothetical protein K438DRAFT_228306 [Mycena galopus ATCC 62051]|nr:hypothetical protein K438DRAFT_228306 [Mycena galopus ATCC 62051]